jgi:hypothetical protein
MLGGDQCTYLEMGRTFPAHRVFNHEPYLIHPPLFGYVIGLLHLMLPLLVSGLLATLLFACLSFFVIRKLALFENLPRTAIFAGLMYLAVGRAAVHYDSHVARVSILVFSTSLALLAFLRFIQEPGRRTLIPVLAANVFSLLVSDQALLLIPCQAVLFWARATRRDWKLCSVLMAASGVAALVWPAVRYVEYSTRANLPAGIDGTIEFTKNIPWLAVIQPNFLPFTNAHRSLSTQTSLSLLNLKLDLLAGLPTDILLLPSFFGIAIIICLIVAAFTRPDRRKVATQWLILSVICLLPVGLGMNEWYSSGYIVPFSLLVMEGAAAWFAWLGSRFDHFDRKLTVGLSAACAIGVVLWLGAPRRDVPSFRPHGGTHFLFSRPAITRGAVIAGFFENIPPDTGIMSPVMLSPEIVYLTGKRVTSLPFDPALLDRFIEEYHVTYLLTSTQFLTSYRKPDADKYFSALVSRYIVEHPERYRLVRTVRENYGAFYPAATYYVFQPVHGTTARSKLSGMVRPAHKV